jgi:purine-nucleoside/S-methyl-5'-thioadenosine phosphorylase / adenosine deaminase
MVTAVHPAPAGFSWTDEPWGLGLRANSLSAVAPHVFTTRALSLSADGGEWQQIAGALGASRYTRLRQVHGADVVTVRRGEPLDAGTLTRADILVSDDPGVAIAVQSADCVPLLIADPVTGAVAAAHAGWRGMAARVPRRAVAALSETFGANPDDLVGAVGPSIGPCCYEVGPELERAFADSGFDMETRRRWFAPRAATNDRLVLDLWTAVADQLESAGMRPARISVARLCTADLAALFPSYRRDRDQAGRIAGAIRARG